MRTSGRMWAVVLALGVAGSAPAAVKKGGTLYVKAKNTRLMESPSTSANVLQVLQPGQEVKWLGTDPKNKQWHQVDVKGKKGLVFQSNLSVEPPTMELVADKGATTRKNAAEFANSAAAVKLLSPGAIKYGTTKDADMKAAVSGLQRLERIAEGVKADKLEEHARQAGLFPVVGPSKGPQVAKGGVE